MCGIAGAVGTTEIDRKVKKMLAALQHRGPDACGIYQAENLSIGNTLLKITGDSPQPLVGKGALVLNGEIFNFRELALESGIKTDSDTCVLFSLIETRIKEGNTPIDAVFSVLSSVNGDYAMAYACDSELVLARDPVGVKPLFYSSGKGNEKPEVFFASEKKGLFYAGRNKAFPTPKSILNFSPEDILNSSPERVPAFPQGSILISSPENNLISSLESNLTSSQKSILTFPPGSIFSFNIQNGSFEERSLKIEPPQARISEEREAAFRLKKALEKAVELRLTSNSGISFSGGIDSAFLAVLAKKFNPAIALYTVGLPDSHDIIQAEKAAEAVGMTDSLKIHLLSLEEIEAAVPHLIHATESVDPMKIAIGLPLYFVAKTAKQDGKRVLLTGQGADELFGGYKRHEGFLEKGPQVLDREIYSDLRNISVINLERDDMVAMANSMELRVPFLDKEVINVGLAISPELKVLKKDGPYIRKYILRKAAESLLPPELLWKEKKAMQYGTGVQKTLDKLARNAGFSKKEGDHVEKYLRQVASEKRLGFIGGWE
jgi:asparagine synthase (glutamine-hydrolysing)